MTCPHCGAPLYVDRDAATLVLWWLVGNRQEQRVTPVAVRACSGCEHVEPVHG